MRVARILLLASLGAAPAASAQVVRGRVTETATAVPIPGALVALLDRASDSSLVSVLTGSSGEYAVRAPAPGAYRVTVKRIGVQRHVSEAFELAPGETRVLDVSIDAVALTLPEVTVSGLCVTRPRELARVASLWEETRTALEATEITIRDRLLDAHITRYAGELDPASLRVLFDWRSDAQVLTTQPFTSMSGDSLSAVGYWRRLPGDSVEYLAPDAAALSSNAFLRDHCFGLASAPRGRPDLTGLTFVPARDRRLPDIAGTIWLDARRFELRSISFRYTGLPDMPNADRAGGEVHFSRLASGAWIVSRWFIRMPQVVSVNALAPRHQLREEGGTVATTGVMPAGPMSAVSGLIRDSAGRPLGGALVRAIGTHRAAVTGAEGRYQLDSLPPGGVSIAVHTNGYDSFGMLAASRRIDVQPGRQHRLDLRARNARDLRNEACADPDLRYVQRARPRGALRLLLVDSVTNAPVGGIRFLVSWPARRDDGLRRRATPVAPGGPEQHHEAVTDSRGAATFCDLPYGYPVEVSLTGPSGERAHVLMVAVNATGITGRVVYARFARSGPNE